MVNLKKIFEYHKEDSLIRDSAILFLAASGLTLSGFLFHFYMGRKLGPASYGDLGIIFSILYIFLVAFFVIQTIITSFVATYKAKNEEDKINVLLRRALKRFLKAGIIIAFLFLLISKFISNFLRINIIYLWIMVPMIILLFLLPVTRGVMQGLENFKLLGFNMTVEGFIKLSMGVLFVFIGFGVAGAIWALFLSYTLAFGHSFFSLKKYISKKEIEFDSKPIYKYAIPVILSLFLFTGFYTIDVLLVKHFFDEHTAGLYIALSFLGKIIFFGTQSVATVMFPKAVSNFTVNKISKKLVNKAMFLVGIIGGLAVIAYFIIPKIAVMILYGKTYLEIVPYLGLYGLVMLILSLSYVLVFYNLSLHRKKFILILLIFIIAEALILTIFHNSIMQIILILLALMSLMYISLLIYTYYDKIINNNTGI